MHLPVEGWLFPLSEDLMAFLPQLVQSVSPKHLPCLFLPTPPLELHLEN